MADRRPNRQGSGSAFHARAGHDGLAVHRPHAICMERCRPSRRDQRSFFRVRNPCSIKRRTASACEIGGECFSAHSVTQKPQRDVRPTQNGSIADAIFQSIDALNQSNDEVCWAALVSRTSPSSGVRCRGRRHRIVPRLIHHDL